MYVWVLMTMFWCYGLTAAFKWVGIDESNIKMKGENAKLFHWVFFAVLYAECALNKIFCKQHNFIFQTRNMADSIYHIKIKKEYASAIIEDLQQVDAIEIVEESIPEWQKKESLKR